MKCTADFPCVCDIFVLAGVTTPCKACAPDIQDMRNAVGYTPHGDKYWWSDKITQDQKDMVSQAISDDMAKEQSQRLGEI